MGMFDAIRPQPDRESEPTVNLARLGAPTVASTGGQSPAVTTDAFRRFAKAVWTMPTVESLKSALTLPGDVWTGKQPMGLPSETEDLSRVVDLAGLVMTGGFAGTGAGGVALGSGPTRKSVMAGSGGTDARGAGIEAGILPTAERSAMLPADDAARMARAREMGYAETPFYRGEATGTVPSKYPGGAFFSRDRETAAGFAGRGGQAEPREFRLNLGDAFTIGEPLTAGQYGRLVESAMRHDPGLATQLAAQFDRAPEWMVGFGKARPNDVITDRGGATLTHELVSKGRAYESVLRDAGFGAVDTGRDVRKLSGFGVREKSAAFDPARADDTNIFVSLASLGLPASALGLATAGRDPTAD